MNEYKNTYINPIPLPDYPIGRKSVLLDMDFSWRETADPTVLYEDGKWYLFSSCRSGYVSDDFITWKRRDIEPTDIGYAPTVVKFRGKYLLCGSLSDLYIADEPMGKYSSLGKFRFSNGEEIGKYYDPMLFADDDGRLYIYYVVWDPEIGSTAINGCELDGDDPTRFAGEPVRLINFDPTHVWERYGEHNEDSSYSALEGPWMFKRNGIYYLIYCGPGTEYSTYANGAYKSTSPLSGFEYMRTSPFTRKTSGVVRGPGHGSVVEGPNGTYWVFYTCTLCYRHPMERMIGYDRIDFDGNGDIICPEVTETPRFAPGSYDHTLSNGDTGLQSLAERRRPSSSSDAPGRDALFALTEDLTSFWMPDPADPEPTLTVPLPPHGADVYAARIIWTEYGLSLKNGAMPGPIGYKIYLRDGDSDNFILAVDNSVPEQDLIVDYRGFDAPIRSTEAKIVITSHNQKIIPGIRNISFFGKA
ncbi:MAG: family 43 glycosylhydrolase [Clostridia bacterium]|nr:family 43 glycosylhydrolase [Clostridia bacterium]